MSLFALIAALLLEQLHPLASRKRLDGWLAGYAGFFRHHLDTGEHRYGRMAWLLAVIPLLIAATALFWLLYSMHPLLAWLFNILVLYLTMGFRQFSHYFTDIHQALRNGELDEARRLLSAWRDTSAHELNAEELARVTIEEALLASERNVFGVITWFVLFSVIGLGGASGALLYRLGQLLHRQWNAGNNSANLAGDSFGRFAQQASHALEWLPIRMTAATFAIVGNFEDSVYCWRTQAAGWPDSEAGILLAGGAGALGVRLGMAIPQDHAPLDRPELGTGDDADTDFMQSTIGLVWRSVVFLLIMLLLMTLASLLG